MFFSTEQRSKDIFKGFGRSAIKMLLLLTDICLFTTSSLFSSVTNYCSSINYSCKTFFTFYNKYIYIFASLKHSVLYMFCQNNNAMAQESCVSQMNNVASIHHSKAFGFLKTLQFHNFMPGIFSNGYMSRNRILSKIFFQIY